MGIDTAFNKEKFCFGCVATHSLHAYLLRLLFVPTLTDVVVQLLTLVWFFVTPWTAAHQASLSITNSQSLLKLIPLSLWCHPSHPLSSPSPSAFNHSLLIKLPGIWPRDQQECSDHSSAGPPAHAWNPPRPTFSPNKTQPPPLFFKQST